MRKILKNNTKTKQYLNSLLKVYITACWANKWGIREFSFSGKFEKENNTYIPLVYDYNDHNGTADQWELVRLDFTTTGYIADWSFNRMVAEDLAKYYNTKENYKNYKRMMEEADEIEFSQKS